MTFGENLRSIRLQRGMSQETLAKLLGTSKQVISRYETNQRVPRITAAEAYAKKLGVSLAELMGEELSSQTENKKIPLVGKIACGEPLFAEESYGVYVSCDASYHADFCLRCKGDSMIGARIMDGDIVFIRKQDWVENGEIAAVVIDDEATLKRVYYYPSQNKLELAPENPSYAPLVYIGAELDRIHILGKAVAFQSKVL